MRLTLPPTAAVLVLVGLLAFGIPGGHSAGAPAVPMPLARASTLLPVLAHAAPRAPPGASGSGTFFQNTVLPLPASGSETCTRGPGASGACLNVTNEPSLNLTSRGLLAVAYTALTNQTPCANVSDNASTEIGFSVSRDLGTSWSAPRYLGNSQCALAAQYPSAWEPSLTSLANGTLVLAYLQYNLTYLGPYAFTSFSYGYAPNAYPSNTPTSRLVVTESYDNGTTWTSPTVLNSSTLGPGQLTSWAPERPWVDAFGDTVYVVWENATQTDLAPQQFYPTFTTAGSLQSHLKVSQDGGRTWGATIDLPVTPGSYQYPYAPEHVGMNPTVAVAPNGTVYVAYVTNVSEDAPVCSPTLCLPDPALAGDVVVGRSTTNGTRFAFTTAASTVALTTLWGPFADPSPRLAFGPGAQVYLAFSAGEVGTYCYPGTYGGCYEGTTPNVFLANSSNGGASFPRPHVAWGGFQNANGGMQNAVYNPALGVSGATVYLEATFVNQSYCAAGSCGVQQQVFLTSTDNGTTFAPPLVLSGNYTPQPYEWDGEYDSLVAAGGRVWAAYVQDLCPDWTVTSCDYLFSPSGVAQVAIAEPFSGSGAQLTFRESGLPAGVPWGVDVLGNDRQGNAPSTLVFSGVPDGQVINWTVPWANASGGVAYVPTLSVSPPWVPSGNLVVNVSFTELVRVVVASEPVFNPCFGPGCTNYVFGVAPGTYWVPAGSTFNDSLTPSTPSCAVYCDYLNLTFLDWAGAGAGSVSTNGLNFSTTVTGPINETAAFTIGSSCTGFGGTVTCLGNFSYPIEFVAHGLPNGTAWSVSVDGVTNTTGGSTMWMDAPNGLANFSVWTVPVGRSTTSYWVPTPDFASPVQVPFVRVVDVNFTRTSLAGAAFTLEVAETGLPGGTPWVVDVGGTNTSIGSVNATLGEPAGATDVSAAPVLEANGTEYVARLARVVPMVENLSAATVGTPVTVDLNGTYGITFQYTPRFLVTASAGTGGTVSPTSAWVDAGNSVTLTASPGPGEQFLGWAGTGSGSTGAGDPHPVVTVFPTGPVTETATFGPRPTVFSVTARSAGLPPGQAFTVGIGATNRTGNGTVVVTNLAPGWYALRVPGTEAAAQNGTRYLAGNVTGVARAANGSFDLTGNVSLTVPFSAEFAVDVAASPGGVVTTTPFGALSHGVGWVANGSGLDLTASPVAGEVFLGWTGTGAGSVSGPNRSIEVYPAAPVAELAQFGPALPPSNASYPVTVSETGLPVGTAWSVVVGDVSATGTGATLSLGALPNGTYRWSVPSVAPLPGVLFRGAVGGPLVVAGRAVNGTVAFDGWVEITVASAGPGAVTPNGTFYWPKGTELSLAAIAGPGARFASWNGSGASSYTGPVASTTITPTAPLVEIAEFEAASPTGAAVGPGTGGLSDASGLEVGLGLLVVLAVAGLLLGRRAGSASPLRPAETGLRPADESIYSSSTPRPPPEGNVPEWSEQGTPDWSEDPPARP